MAKTVVIPSNPADQKVIRDCVQEIVDAMTRIEGEKSLMKEIRTRLKDEYQLPGKFVTGMARAQFNQNFDNVVAEKEDFEELYETVFRLNQDDNT